MSDRANANTRMNALEARVGAALLARGWTVCAAESCTGGLIMHRLTNVAGSSAYVLGGVVSYSNAAKQKIIGVREATLIAYGAVSEQTAAEMVRACAPCSTPTSPSVSPGSPDRAAARPKSPSA